MDYESKLSDLASHDYVKRIHAISVENLAFFKQDYFFCYEEMQKIMVKFNEKKELLEGAYECLTISEENLKDAIRNLNHWQKRLREYLKISSPETESRDLKADWHF